MSKQNKNNVCAQHVVNLYFSGNSMNNLSSYCGLSYSRMRASDMDLPVQFVWNLVHIMISFCPFPGILALQHTPADNLKQRRGRKIRGLRYLRQIQPGKKTEAVSEGEAAREVCI